MAKSGLKHIDVGNELTKTEWESEESHELVHGNSFPGSPVERQLFYRDDEHKWYVYNGSSWVWLGGGGGAGDMLKSVYDTDDDGVVDNSELLEGSTKAEVQDHTPKAHTLASHSTKAHSELTGVGADDHHNQSHTLASHSTKPHSALTGVGADDHHNKQHDIASAPDHTSSAASGHLLKADANGLPVSAVVTELEVAADHTKLAGIESGATKYPDTGEQAFLDADHNKLDGIEAAADVTANHDPKAHKTSHENGGSDELSLAGLDGEPATLTTHKALTTGIHGVGSGTVGIKDKDSVIQDADGDTKWQMGEDYARLNIAGIERSSIGEAKAQKTANHWLFASDAGIISFPKQSGGMMYQGTTQYLRANNGTFARLTHVLVDIQGECDISVVSGTNTSIAANKLIDSGASFVAGDLGRIVWNKADNTYAKVTNVDSATQLTLDADIFPSPAGDAYELYFSKFTAKESGQCIICGSVRLNNASAEGRMAIDLNKNATRISEAEVYVAAGKYPAAVVLTFVDLAADDYIQLEPYPVTGAIEDTFVASKSTFLAVVKVG